MLRKSGLIDTCCRCAGFIKIFAVDLFLVVGHLDIDGRDKSRYEGKKMAFIGKRERLKLHS